MKCSKCDYENDDEAKFCENCGCRLSKENSKDKDDSRERPAYIIDQQKSLKNQPKFNRSNQSAQFSRPFAFQHGGNSSISSQGAPNVASDAFYRDNSVNNSGNSSTNSSTNTVNASANSSANSQANSPANTSANSGNNHNANFVNNNGHNPANNPANNQAHNPSNNYANNPANNPNNSHSLNSNTNNPHNTNGSHNPNNHNNPNNPYGHNNPNNPVNNPNNPNNPYANNNPQYRAPYSRNGNYNYGPTNQGYRNGFQNSLQDASQTRVMGNVYTQASAPAMRQAAVSTAGAATKAGIAGWKIAAICISILAAIGIIGGIWGYNAWVNRFQVPYGELHSKLLSSKKAQAYKVKIVGSDVSNYPDVKLYFSVTDKSGNSLELDSPTAAIKEKISGGAEVERRIRNVERIKDKQGVGYEIMLDKSYSMINSMDTMKKTMKDFVNALNYKVGDRGELISFDSYLMYMATYTKDKDRLITGINNMTPYGNTALYDALYTGVNNASQRSGANCVIAFTDGEDNSSTHTMDEVVQLAKEKNIPIYLIGTADADSSTLQSIADETNGFFWSMDSISDMSEVLNRIKMNQDNLYCLEYESDSSSDPYSDRIVSALLADSNDHTNGGIGEDLQFAPVKKEKVQKAVYKVYKGDVTWTEANDACMREGAHLVTIPSKKEEDKIIKLAVDNDLKYVWIGGYTSQRQDGDVFAHWITGEKTTYTNWMEGEPSRNDKDGSPEFYLMLWRIGSEWSWNDQRNNVYNSPYLHKTFSGRTGYVCKVDAQN